MASETVHVQQKVAWRSAYCDDRVTLDGEQVPREDVELLGDGSVMLRGEWLDGAQVSISVDRRPGYIGTELYGFERGPTLLNIQTPAYAAKLNPGIRKVVALLRSHGFATCDSGDGETHDYECDRDEAYVVMQCAPGDLGAESRRLMTLLSESGVVIAPIGTDGAPSIQGSLDPADGTATIELMGVDDSMLRGIPPLVPHPVPTFDESLYAFELPLPLVIRGSRLLSERKL